MTTPDEGFKIQGIECEIPAEAVPLYTLGLCLFIAPDGQQLLNVQPGVLGEDELKPSYVVGLGMLEMAKDMLITREDDDDDGH